MSEMNNNRIKVSAGALILAALIYYTADFGTLACVAVPVLIHELGHIVCLRLLGLRICGFKAELRGLCMAMPDARAASGAYSPPPRGLLPVGCTRSSRPTPERFTAEIGCSARRE